MEINHEEAKENAAYRVSNSNLARCYLDLLRKNAELSAELEKVRSALDASNKELRRVIDLIDDPDGEEHP